jgi:hypothetical protein
MNIRQLSSNCRRIQFSRQQGWKCLKASLLLDQRNNIFAVIAAIAAKEKKVSNRLMILPAKDPAAIRLIRIPEDYEEHEVFRHVTGIIASVEENNPEYAWDDIQTELEDQGFESIAFILGPELD